MDVQVSRVRKLIEPDPSRPATCKPFGVMATCSFPMATASEELTSLQNASGSAAMPVPLQLAQPLALRWVVAAAGPVFLLSWGGNEVVLQLLLGQRLDRARMVQMGRDFGNVRLSEVALEQFPPSVVSSSVAWPWSPAINPHQPAMAIGEPCPRAALELCRRLPYCPEVSPTLNPGHRVWVELLNPQAGVVVCAVATQQVVASGSPAGVVVVDRQQCGVVAFSALGSAAALAPAGRALARVGLEEHPEPVPQEGAGEVQRLSQRFNAMLARHNAAKKSGPRCSPASPRPQKPDHAAALAPGRGRQ